MVVGYSPNGSFPNRMGADLKAISIKPPKKAV